MSRSDDLFNEWYDLLKDEYDHSGHRVDQEEVDRMKKAPQGESLVVDSRGRGLVPAVRVPAVNPPTDNRRGKKEAEAERMRLWRMGIVATRTAVANESILVVGVHAFRVMDRAAANIGDEFYGRKRPEAMNELMKRFAAKCLSCTESGISAILESHPKRIAEHL